MRTKLPCPVVSDGHGRLREIAGLEMAGMSRCEPIVPHPKDLIPLPPGSRLLELPGRVPIGYDPRSATFREIEEGQVTWAAAAFMPPGYVQICSSAYRILPEGFSRHAPPLPLYSYTAVGWQNGRFYAAGKRVDPDMRHNPQSFDLGAVEREGRRMLERFPRNHLVRHLVDNCAFRYGCDNARNFILKRWECPVPVSRYCNAACLGCISRQSEESLVPSCQDRISFTPEVGDIVEYTVFHLEKANRPMVSFGQGCEGEPLLAGDLIEEAIRQIRRRTARGVIHLNTNASLPQTVERLFRAGLDSVRVSINSAQKSHYEAYYRPKQYCFEDVVASLKIARDLDRWVSLNYLVFPGFTDHPTEIAALDRLIEDVCPDMIQTRNLNIDPQWYVEKLDLLSLSEKSTGIRRWLSHMKERHPALRIGYFNPIVQ